VSPDLLRTGRTESANTPIPEGWVSALTLYPGNPVTDRLGQPRSFVTDLYRFFQRQLELFGLPGCMEEKARITAAVVQGHDPGNYIPADGREVRKAARIALRQIGHFRPDAPNLEAWRATFDRGPGSCPAESDDH
jgi:hypothetical protein